jgi:hypothetical protein
MGGGKGGGDQKVPNYYMSVQYGICHGPIDTLNQLFCKEKIILCDEIGESTVLYFNKPELFGGETKEGGINGVIEYFKGSADQKMTDVSAARFGKTSDTMLGYRGVSHLFCRGYEDSELVNMPSASQNTASRGGFYGLLIEAFTLIFSGTQNTAIQKGFLWQTNNPYMPSIWAHVTRIPKPYGEAYAYVPAPFGGGENALEGTLFVNFGSGSAYETIDVSSLADSIDTGVAVVTVDFGFYSNYTGLGGDGPAPISGRIQGDMLNAAGEFIPEDVPGEGGWLVSTAVVQGGTTIQMVRTLKPGTRSLRLWSLLTPTFPLFSLSGASTRKWSVNFTTNGPLLCDGTPAAGSPFNANPAYMIAECLTNRQWAMGHPIAGLDGPSFTAAAASLYSEFFGLAMLWSEQTTIEKFIMEVLDHIQGVLFTDPSTGLWTLKLIRGDYTPESLRTLNGTNSVASDRQRKAEGEIINEIVISYKDFQTEEDKTVTFHDIAGIAQLGEIVSDTRNYYGIRSDTLANLVGGRDIRSASYPLFSCNVEADRSFRNVRPGDVLKLDVPEDGIVGMVVRILKVDYGQPGDSKVRFNVTEDIFGLPATEYTVTQGSLWETTDALPLPLAQQRAIEPPLPLLLRSGVSDTAISDEDYPEVVTAMLGDDNDQDVQTISLWGDEVSPSGAVTQKVIGTLDRTTYGTTNAILAEAPTGVLPGLRVRAAATGETPDSGDFFYLDGTNEAGEFVMLDVYDLGTDTWTIARAIYDTVPREWPSGTVMWYIGTAFSSFDPSANAADVTTTFKLLPRTNGGLLNEEDAVTLTHTPSARPYLPFRPADTKVDGNSFGVETHYASNDPGGIPATIPASWATRNRLQEDGVAARWTDASVTPEAGQTVMLRVVERDSQVVYAEFSGLTGSSYAMPTASLFDYRFYDVHFIAVRDGFESLQYASLGLDLERLGYGNNYGFDYGENNGS